jgi:hypothetical protein
LLPQLAHLTLECFRRVRHIRVGRGYQLGIEAMIFLREMNPHQLRKLGQLLHDQIGMICSTAMVEQPQ